MKTIKCKVCKAEIGFFGWNKHVEKHKREVCKIIGKSPKEYYTISWKEVLKLTAPITKQEHNYLEYAQKRLKEKYND